MKIKYLLASIAISLAVTLFIIPSAAMAFSINVDTVVDESVVKDADIFVYKVLQKDWEKIIKDKRYKLEPVEKAPSKLTGLNPGVYMIGIGVKYDTNMIPSGVISTDPYHYGPIPKKYYLDDLQSATQARFIVGKNPNQTNGLMIMPYFIKWYYVDIKDRDINIVSLFMKKGLKLTDYTKYYPAKEKYQISSKANVTGFWEFLATNMDLNLSEADKKIVIQLLKRGGKVYLPNGDRPGAVYIKADGSIGMVGR